MVYPKTRMKQSRREPRQPLKYHTLLLSSLVTIPVIDNQKNLAVKEDISDKYRITYENVNINDIVRFSSGGVNVYALIDRITKNSIHLIILKHKVVNGKNYFYKTDNIIPGLSSGGKNYAKFTRKIIKIGNW